MIWVVTNLGLSNSSGSGMAAIEYFKNWAVPVVSATCCFCPIIDSCSTTAPLEFWDDATLECGALDLASDLSNSDLSTSTTGWLLTVTTAAGWLIGSWLTDAVGVETTGIGVGGVVSAATWTGDCCGGGDGCWDCFVGAAFTLDANEAHDPVGVSDLMTGLGATNVTCQNSSRIYSQTCLRLQFRLASLVTELGLVIWHLQISHLWLWLLLVAWEW